MTNKNRSAATGLNRPKKNGVVPFESVAFVGAESILFVYISNNIQ